MKLAHPCHTAVLAAVLLNFLLRNAFAVSLNRYNSCPDLVSYFRNNALSRVGAYGLSDSRNFGGFRPSLFCGPFRGGPGGFGGEPILFANAAIGGDGAAAASVPLAASASLEGAAAAPQPAPAREQVAGVDFSETNVQVEGVDEPDIIKTDGNRVFVVRGRKFFVVKVASGGSNGYVTGELSLPSHAREMLIQGDHLLVIAQTFGSIYPTPLLSSVGGFFFDQSLTTVYQIKVTNGVPKLVSTLRMEGRYLNSREVDGVARIVTLYRPHLRFKFPSCVIPYAEAEAHNQDIIRRSTEREWYPSYSLKVDGQAGETTDLISSCSNVYIPGIFPGFELLTVVTLPVSGNLKPTGSVSIVSEGDEVYSTASSLYVTTTEYRWDFFGFENSLRSGRNFETSIHKFSLNNYGANYVASGEVSGSVLNQFSMHEFNGYFFIATTDGAPWWGARDESSSKVTSFRPYGRSLRKIGEVGNLGLGERIFAVRYVKDTAYVVTFRQIDPLYIIDLSRPWWLRVTGELKIPGFSSYLHPISPGRILGVGQDATPEGRVTGSKVTLFDVSDKTNPTELSSWTLSGGRSTAEWDHRAFLYWDPESVAVLPVSAYFGSERFVGSVVLKVSTSSIQERGRITHEAISSSRYSPSIERNIVLGGEHLWSLSSKQLQVNNIKDLSKESVTSLN
ncbi:hypothetical protein BWQ96_10176 [Gracilariopsis chorda]|uniref:Beta propeller domain-containing protein n=1 Tax=Gracilariopsis chorda TaxID=448386 RepID=A0A2V3IDF1_9FLOR|nr:hypothetical protein BWQ96_10176 [Gracilariopsis chorda]|eukprot:PXF40115.1 hypothetical protein BWQ96_10176 [Gracilariopsis chorda]